jgi:hypothetical protein
MTPDIFTTSNADIDSRYGRQARSTWQWPVRVYTDEELDADPVWRDWRRAARGREDHTLDHTTVRFSYKVQAQLVHWSTSTAKYMTWLDTDVTQHREIDQAQWLKLMPWGTESVTFLDRQPYRYAETGWIAYRRDQCSQQLIQAVAAEYLSGGIWNLDQWHDAYVWDTVRLRLGTPSRSLAPPQPSAEARDNNIWPRSELSEYFQHHKGRRKLSVPNLVQKLHH